MDLSGGFNSAQHTVSFPNNGGDLLTYDVVIVGGGAAGVGVAVALKDAGIHNVVIIDRDRIGSSFDHWPAETQFITPSFPSNSIGMLDLNSIAIGVSPGFSMKVEHPTGPEYAEHLRAVAGFFELPVREQTEVQQIKRADGLFLLETEHQIVRSRHVIWAAGEFQYPRMKGPIGIDLCRHTATVERYADLTGDDFIIVGGFESGI
ncbi:MAG: FAD-dependent oxidoreductase, partial [Pseudomonadota bacterium]